MCAASSDKLPKLTIFFCTHLLYFVHFLGIGVYMNFVKKIRGYEIIEHAFNDTKHMMIISIK